MGEYIIEEENTKEFKLFRVISEDGAGSKELVGIFYTRGEAEFHKFVREKTEDEMV